MDDEFSSQILFPSSSLPLQYDSYYSCSSSSSSSSLSSSSSFCSSSWNSSSSSSSSSSSAMMMMMTMMKMFPAADPPSPWPWPPPAPGLQSPSPQILSDPQTLLPPATASTSYDHSSLFDALLLDLPDDDHLHILEDDHLQHLHSSISIPPVQIYPAIPDSTTSDGHGESRSYRCDSRNEDNDVVVATSSSSRGYTQFLLPADHRLPEEEDETEMGFSRSSAAAHMYNSLHPPPPHHHHGSSGAGAGSGSPLTILRGHGQKKKEEEEVMETRGVGFVNNHAQEEEEETGAGILVNDHEDKEEAWMMMMMKTMMKRRSHEEEVQKKKLKKNEIQGEATCEEEEEEEILCSSSSSRSRSGRRRRRRSIGGGGGDVVHVRARRGQATDSHSLAERVRREKINRRMKLLQDLVPNCNKVLGKAALLEEIINYVKSLQCQIEFLSIRLAQSNPTTILGGQIICYKPEHM